jgi:uncharacterized protein (DUF58 family)
MQQYIDLKTLARVKDMPLVAKTLAQGFLHGLHRGDQRGVGVEFSQYRVYEPGDDLAKVDWKLFARSDKYFVREAERESEINVWLVLDSSRSMMQKSQGTTAGNGWHKLEYARYLLATMAYIAQKQGDAVGFLGLSSEQVNFMPAKIGDKHWHQIMLQLARINGNGNFARVDRLTSQIAKMRSNGIIFFISDFYQNSDEIINLVQGLAGSKNEVVAISLSCDDEELFAMHGTVCFEDLESGERIVVSPRQIKQDYLSARQAFQVNLKAQLAKLNVQLVNANIDQPLDQTLADFLTARQRLSN